MVLWRPRRCMWHAVLFGAAVVVITCVLTWNHLGTSVTRYMYSLNSTYITTQLNLRTELLSPINDSIENQMQETDIGVIKENTSQRTSTNLGNQSAKTEDRRSDVTQLHEYYNLNSSKPFKIRDIHRHIEPDCQFEIFTNQSKTEIGKASLHRIVEETSGNTEAKIVIILAYMHTGSTYTASIINNHPGTFYEFEPLRSLQKSSRESRWIQFLNGTTRRLSGEVINTHIGAEAVSNMITCNHDMLDITTLSKQYPLSITGGTSDFFICKNDTYKRSTNNIQGHKSKLNYLGLPQTNLSLNTYSQLGRWEKFYGEQNRLQLEQLQQLQTHLNGSEYSRGRHERSQVRHIGGVKSEVESCLPRLTSKCKNAHIRLTKFIRMTMGMTEELLTKFDNIRIIHLLRDARAMMDSELRKNEMHVSSFPVFQSRTHYMCSRMQSDLIIADKLKRTFPGRIFTLRYEDLVDEPLHTGQRIFSFIKVPFTHLDEQFIVSKSIEVSKNSTYRANVWRHHISQKHLTVVNKYCSELSRRLGYISFKSVDDVRNLKLPDHFKYINTSSFNY